MELLQTSRFFCKKSQTSLLKIYLMGLFTNVSIIFTSICTFHKRGLSIIFPAKEKVLLLIWYVSLINSRQNGVLNLLQMAAQWHLLILYYWIEYCDHYFCAACFRQDLNYATSHNIFCFMWGLCINCLKCYKISYYYNRNLSQCINILYNITYIFICVCLYIYKIIL